MRRSGGKKTPAGPAKGQKSLTSFFFAKPGSSTPAAARPREKAASNEPSTPRDAAAQVVLLDDSPEQSQEEGATASDRPSKRSRIEQALPEAATPADADVTMDEPVAGSSADGTAQRPSRGTAPARDAADRIPDRQADRHGRFQVGHASHFVPPAQPQPSHHTA